MNATVVEWCRREALEVTRSRAYRKNNQAWVEQKNGAIVGDWSATAGSKARWPAKA